MELSTFDQGKLPRTYFIRQGQHRNHFPQHQGSSTRRRRRRSVREEEQEIAKRELIKSKVEIFGIKSKG